METNQPPQPDRPVIDITPESSLPYDTGSFRSFEHVMRRRRRIFFGLSVLFSVLAGIWLWTLPKVFQATTTVLLSRVGQSPTPITEGEIASEIQLVLSQASSLGKTGGAVSQSAQAAEAQLREIRRHIDVRQTGKSQILGISYTDGSSKFAADQANILTGLYLQQRQRLLGSPTHLVAIEAEAATLSLQADEAAKALADFEAKARGDSFRIKSQKLAALEDRAFELRATVRGQEEVVRVLKQTASSPAAANPAVSDVLQNEAQLAGMRAKLREMEREFARLEQIETQAGNLTAKREELVRRANLARERAEFVSRRLQETRIDGMSLQARLLSAAEVISVRAFDLTWWQILLTALGIIAAAWIGSAVVELFDRPVHSEDEFARMTGVPPIDSAVH